MNSDQHAVRAARAAVQDVPGRAIELVLFDYEGHAVFGVDFSAALHDDRRRADRRSSRQAAGMTALNPAANSAKLFAK